MMPRTIELVVLGTLLCLLISTRAQNEGTAPPRFKQMPPKEVSFKISDIGTVIKTLTCVADAEPPATYEWTKDGEILTITGVDIKKKPGVGTLIIEHPTDDHEGIYQCRATNEYGTAMAVKTHFRAARLEPFATKLQPTVHKPEVGTSMILRCNPPNSYPEPSVYWGESKLGSKLRPIDTDDRVSLDFDGNLYFSNIKRSDGRGGKNYVCIVSNGVLRGLVQGDDQKIEPKQSTVTTKYQDVKLMWSSPSPDTAIAGTEKILKCIFSGFPTPIVEWTRIDKELSDKIYFMNNKLSLVIPTVDYDDAGSYKCSAYNVKGGRATEKTIKLEVESVPTFVQAPENEVKAEEEDVTFICRAGGKPRPEVEWYINGVPVDEAPADPRRTVTDDSLTIKNLTKTDSQVFQCNITNRHGYQFENAYLNVLAEPPSFLNAPDAVTKAAEGMNAMISCRVFGAPEPVVTWTVNGTEVTLNSHFEKLENGSLYITDVYLRDHGTYKCHAVNKFGDIEQAGELVVRTATKITKGPSDQTVNASSSVTFECEAHTDEEEEDHLEIRWLKDGEEINYESEPTITMNKRDDSLTISPARVADSGEFRCVAGNGLDTDAVTANLIVKDRPDPPYRVQMAECGSSYAEITWEPGNENNDEVIAFYVYYNTSFDDQGQFHEGAEVLRGTNNAKIGLSPWANYTFHVRAENSLGMSDKSEFTSVVCKTQASIPLKNPDGVCTDSRDPSQLIITWKIMERIDHNGPDFHYIVGYKRTDGSDGPNYLTEKITDYKTSEFAISGTETFEEFEIYVQAANDEGTTRPNRLKKRYGYSGEGVPNASPTNFAIDDSSVNATSAIFTWTGVPDDPEIMQGHLIGYDIVFWKADDPENKRIHTVSAGPHDPCPLVRTRNKRQAGGDPMEGHVLNLWPFSDIQAGVLVKNSKHSGALSDPPISFRTPEGVPEKVMRFEVEERGSHHFVVGWEPPSEPNGILLGYNVGHRPSDDPNAEITKQFVDDPLKRSTKMKGLDPEKEYILYIWARTNAGQGKMDFLEDKTAAVGPIDTPELQDFIHGDDSLNVSWIPSKKDDSKNPGSDFYVKYRKPGEENWTTVEPDDPDENSVNITGLTWGDDYEIVVVAVDGDGNEKESEPRVITLGQNPEPVTQSVASAGWFIAMMCAIIFLLLILIIVCLIKRNRGGKYPVHEKEKLRGRDPDKEDEEGGFGEYTRTDEPDYKKSAGSINDETKPLGESDSDSMAEYDETDPSKFNEDGSFIGQYGGKKKGDKMEPDATSPSALSTFV